MGKSRFYASIFGNKGDGGRSTEATRAGVTGIQGHIRGWNSGIKVVGSIDTVLGDNFDVFITSGSNGGSRDVLVGCFVADEWIPAKVK
jgi:hypothetical protein